MDTKKIKLAADDLIKGANLRPVNFEPTSGKWQSNVCKGFQIHITKKEKFRPYLSSLILMQLIIKYHKNEFEFKNPPYEYEYEKMPMDLILGSRKLREKLMNLENLSLLSNQWEQGIEKFKSLSGKYYLYE